MSIGQYFPSLEQLWFAATSYPILKTLSAVILTVGSFFFDTLQHTALLALVVLIIFDMISAIIAAKKTGEEITSQKAVRSAGKTAVYFFFVSAGFITENTVPLNIIDDTIIAFLAVTELISIAENLGKSGYPVPQNLLNQLKTFRNNK